MTAKLKKILLTLFSTMLCSVIIAAALAVCYAYYSNLPRVYTDDNSSEIARIGMRVNLLFDRLDSTIYTDSSHALEITYADGRTGTFYKDNDADWGTIDNPYIISLPRHMLNLYALQRSGYFYDKFISENYSNDTYIENSQSIPYFLVCNTDGSPATINGNINGSNVEIMPIGNERYPFIGSIGGAQISGTTLYDGKTSDSSVIANFVVLANDNEIDVGLFGKIGYMGDETAVTDETFNGYISTINDILICDVQIKSRSLTLLEQIANHLFSSTQEDHFHEDHHIGILAGHIEYASITNISIYYSGTTSAASVDAINVSTTGGTANYMSDSGIIGFVYNLNPDYNPSSNTVGSGTGTTIAGVAEGAGEEWGASIDMYSLHQRLQAVLAEAKRSNPYSYVNSETFLVDMDDNVSLISSSTANYPNPGSAIIRTYYSEDGGSFVFADENNNTNSARYNLFHGVSKDFFPKTVTTYTETGEEAGFTVSYVNNGVTYYMNAATATATAVSTTNSNTENAADNATIWRLNNGRIDARDINTENNTRYLNASNAGVISIDGTASTTNWALDGNELYYTDTNGNRWYLRYNNGWSAYPFRSTFTVSNGTNYLGRNNSTTNFTGTNANAAVWELSGGKMATLINNAVYYLNVTNGALSLATTASINSWQKEGTDKLYYTDTNGVKWYLRYDNGWNVYPSATSYTISDGTYYISNNGTNATIANNTATRWIKTDENRLYTVINGSRYFLYANGTSLSVTATENNGIIWNNLSTVISNNGNLSYTSGGRTFYLYRQNTSWVFYPFDQVSLISQNGTYLNIASASAVSGSNTASTYWNFNNGAVSTYYNNNIYYLNATGANVSVSQSNNTVWTKNANGTLSYNDGTRNWYLAYTNDEWKAYPSLSYSYIKYGNNYLYRSSTTAVGNQTTPTDNAIWFKDGDKLFNLNGTTPYYLVATTTALSVNGSAANGTEFTYDDTNKRLSFTQNATTYYVVYENGWKVKPDLTKGVYIATASGGTTYYLNATNSGVNTGTDIDAATSWTFTNNRFSTVIGTQTYYLRAALETNNKRNSTNLTVTTTQNQATTFTYTNNNLTCTLAHATYSLALDNQTLKMVNTAKTYYTISYDTHYLGLNGTAIYDDTQNTATLWEFSTTTQNSNSTISTLYNGTETRYLYVTRSGTALNRTYTLSSNTNTFNWRYNNNSYLQERSWQAAYLRYNGSNWVTTTSSQALTRAQVRFTAATVTMPASYFRTSEEITNVSAPVSFNDSTPASFRFAEQTENLTHAFSTPVQTALVTVTAKNRKTYNKTVTTVAGGKDTFFPLVADSSATFDVQKENTGYIVGGSHASYQSEWGDVRIAYYPYNNGTTTYYLSNSFGRNATSYANNYTRMEILTQTYLSKDNNGNFVLSRIQDAAGLTDEKGNAYSNYSNTNNNTATAIRGYTKSSAAALGLTKYADAKAQLHVTLRDNPTQIYGLHFMDMNGEEYMNSDGTVNQNLIVTAPKVMINGETFYNYEMPEDCIDFKLKSKGYINFFAGTYYLNSGYENNSFFSLYKIERNSDNTIKSINRIREIYGKFVDGKLDLSAEYKYVYYNNADTSDVYNNNAGYQKIFETKWIEGIDGVNIIQKAIYYFEIPVNKGEYALGSVPEAGQYGAYLMYLDIGASAAGHNSVLGSIDFVYDNLSGTILTVKDYDENDETVAHYRPSQIIIYTKNTDRTGESESAPFVEIDDFIINIRRYIEALADTQAKATITFTGEDDTHLAAVTQTKSGDNLTVSPDPNASG
ncbi:MAG: hypothetical protein J6Z34_01440 [Clostridia bacterium]|nr:hypothetical protein [Clostridia bacterium]